jgi:hypothetical protein
MDIRVVIKRCEFSDLHRAHVDRLLLSKDITDISDHLQEELDHFKIVLKDIYEFVLEKKDNVHEIIIECLLKLKHVIQIINMQLEHMMRGNISFVEKLQKQKKDTFLESHQKLRTLVNDVKYDNIASNSLLSSIMLMILQYHAANN